MKNLQSSATNSYSNSVAEKKRPLNLKKKKMKPADGVAAGPGFLQIPHVPSGPGHFWLN